MFNAGLHAEAETAARDLLQREPRSGFLWKVLGAALQMQGKDALHALKQASIFLSNDAEAHNILGVALHGAGQSGAALACYGKALKLRPGYADAYNNLGMTLQDLGRSQEALTNLRRALKFDPRHVQAHNNLGNVQLRLRQLDEAAASYRQAIALLPQYAEAHNNLGNALHTLGRLEEAAASYRRALAHKPGYASALSNLAVVQQEQGLFDAALQSCRQALALDPHCAKAHANMASILQETGQTEAALEAFARALDLVPDMPEALSNLGNSLRELGRLDDAAAYCRRAVAADAQFVEAYVNLGFVQRQQGLDGAARESCRAALEIDPKLAGAVELAAELAADGGNFAAAEAAYRHAFSLAPQAAQTWAGITRVRKMSADDTAWHAAAETLLAQGLAPRKEVSLRYALGKYCDDLGDYDGAFAHYRSANELSRRYTTRYRRDSDDRAIDALVRNHGAAWFGRAHPGASTSTRPVFIVGMPRSGTSLAEQIVASHPAVHGAGELPFWRVAAPGFDANREDVDTQLAALAQRYLAALQEFPAQAARVVDKMPSNFRHIGLILAAFPNARFIHMRRNPADTCLSIYFQHFNTTHTYANDLEHLAHHYAGYQRLMAHWHSVVPAHAMLDVPYEELVRDQEGWSRKMIEFLGLPWDPRCLAFHECRRAVSTASNWQVRQKISTASIERWRHYEAHLGPLKHLL